MTGLNPFLGKRVVAVAVFLGCSGHLYNFFVNKRPQSSEVRCSEWRHDGGTLRVLRMSAKFGAGRSVSMWDVLWPTEDNAESLAD